MSDVYILDGTAPVKCDDIIRWARWFETADRQVAKTDLPGGVCVSTVFIGIDHRFVGKGAPIVFETMIFGGKHDQEMWRYETWEEALSGHDDAVRIARKS